MVTLEMLERNEVQAPEDCLLYGDFVLLRGKRHVQG